MVRQGWPYAAALVVVVLLVTVGIWGFNQHQIAEEGKASVIYAQGLDALATNDLDGADRKFALVSASAPPGYRSLALMQQAGVQVAKNNTAMAVQLLDRAAKTAPDEVLADVARLKAAYLLMDTRPLADIEARLTPLTGEKRPYRMLAREALGLARLQAGKIDAARGDFTVLSLSQDVSDQTRARAQAALALIQSGTAGSLPAATKLAAVLPPVAIPAAQPVPQSAQAPEQAGAAQ
jgi:hypothetical protein